VKGLIRRQEFTVEAIIRQVLADHGQLSTDVYALSAGADLYRSGLSSHATVNVMLGLEDAFEIDFPDRLLRKDTFQTIETIRAAVDEVRSGVKTGA
jgi:acyl carrier protein